jgi:hypothetical protein
MKRITISFTTNGSGAATALASFPAFGSLYAIEYRHGTALTGATLVVTCESDTSKPLLTKANAGTATSLLLYPRDLVHDAAGTPLSGLVGGDCEPPALNGYPQVAITSGGATRTGTVVIYYEP